METLFEKTIEIVKQLNHRKWIESKTLPVEKRIELAKECLNQVKDHNEYKEIEASLKELQEEFSMGLKGISFKKELLDEEQINQIVNVINEEFKAADKEYNNLKREAESVRTKYLAEMDAILLAMKAIESNYKYVRNNISLPAHSELDFSNINFPLWGLSTVDLLIETNNILKKRNLA